VEKCSTQVSSAGPGKILAELKDDSGLVGAALLAFG
jgi:hypothetical protein